MSQIDRVLAMLRDAGPKGVHSVDIRRAYVADPSRRIVDLRELGCVIDAVKERSPYGRSTGKRYILRYDPMVSGAAAGSSPSAAAPETPGLFDLSRTPYDPYEAA